MSHTEVLRAELERLFDLDELIQLSSESLGFDPTEVGSQATLGSFAGALVSYCEKEDAIFALADALRASGRDLHPRIISLLNGEPDKEALLSPGSSLGGYQITRKIGEGRVGVTYVARGPDGDVRLKVLTPEASRDRRGLQRYLTATRLIHRAHVTGVPELVFAGRLEDRYVVIHKTPEGQPLALRVGRTGPMHINEARAVISAVSEVLSRLHAKGLVHGDLSLDNILTYRLPSGETGVSLLDAGTHFIRMRPGRTRTGLASTGSNPRTVSPEQIRGAEPTAHSDAYALGAVMFELLTGKPPFEGDALEMAYGHLTRSPATPSSLAPRGWVGADLDQLVLSLLAKEPDDRVAISLLPDRLEELIHSRRPGQDQRQEAEELEQKLVADPTNLELAAALEATVGHGVSAEQVGQAFRLAASMLDDAEQAEDKKRLLLRAARLFEAKKETLEKAEQVYAELLAEDPRDPVVQAGYDEALKRQEKFDALVEALLGRAENAANNSERARAMAEIGRTYLRDLGDTEQAVIALSQAFCDDPSDEYATDLERAAGTQENLWNEVLSAVGEASQDASLSPEQRSALLLRAGLWYRGRLSRTDLAVPCFQAVLATEPANEQALVQLTEIYRKAQQWQELIMMLHHRANAAATPQASRDLRTEIAEIQEQRLGQILEARATYEAVLAEDPSHPKANEGLFRILDRAEDYPALVQFIERRLESESPQDRVRSLCRVAEIYDTRLDNSEQALAQYKRALEIDPESIDALHGIENVLTKQGKYRELLENLEQQVAAAATPKQKVLLFERMASVYEEEFIDQKGAASALERALALDPNRVTALSHLTRIFKSLGRFEDASRLYERQARVVDSPEERIALGMAWGRLLAEELGEPEKAARAYEIVLEANPEHPAALEALAKLREATGDAARAVEAILSLADKAETPEARAEQYLRAAKLLEARGQRELAIEHYRNALDANPSDHNIAVQLRAAYLALGDIGAALELLEQELEATDSDRLQGKLSGEMARILYDKSHDDARAKSAAERAIRLDGTNFDGLYVLGHLAFDEGHFLEASTHFARTFDRLGHIDAPSAIRTLERYIDALGKTGSAEAALAAAGALAALAPNDVGALSRVASIRFDHGTPAEAEEAISAFLKDYGSSASKEVRARMKGRLAESIRRQGRAQEAIPLFQEALELDPSEESALLGLAEAYAEAENWAEVIGVKVRQLDHADSDARVQLLVDISEIAAQKIGDRNYAAKSLVAALEERPDDRRLLSRLMQLYSEEKDWDSLVDVVAKLAEFAEGPEQKVKYLITAALVSIREIGDGVRAASYFRQVLELDPQNEKALKELIELERAQHRFTEVEQLLVQQIDVAEAKNDTKSLIKAYDSLADLYQKNLVDLEQAAAALEAALALDPENPARLERLSAIYLSDPAKFAEKGIELHEQQLRKNPFRQESYKALRKIYTVERNADASWGLCQVLHVLNLAEPDEERFFLRMRSETAAPAQEAFDEASWGRVMHPTIDPLLTMIFALIEPAVVKARSQSVESLGLGEHFRIDPSQHEATISQTLYYAAGVLGVELPAVYLNPTDGGGLSYLLTPYPALQMGRVALSSRIPPQVAAFVAAQKLAYSRPGLFLRHFIQTGTALKAWLFAAIKLSSPQFPVTPDIEGSVQEGLQALRQNLSGDAKDHLASTVSKLIQSGTSLDLKKWTAAADLTADRAGFVVCHDLETAVQVIRSDASSSLSPDERVKELVSFASSRNYFETRKHLGITVES